ncbi:MAG: molybdopterin molybdotransferase MoeA [Emcibacter sp.]|nr:molybdopterin molybdotransferase MoeA [Emcibacter sp.]
MLPYKDALKIILADVNIPERRDLPLDETLGAITATRINGTEYLPPFHNSAMDGFAVISRMTKGASQDNPITLTVDGSTMAGDFPETSSDFTAKGAWEIMTGAPVPAGYDAVIRIEDINILARDDNERPAEISIMTEAFEGKNIRKAGTDFCPGDLLMEKGIRIGPNHIMALAALGQENIPVVTPPKVAVISTGKELVDDMARPLKPGQIRNSNAPYLLKSLAAFGIAARNEGTIFDEPEKFEQKIQALLSDDIQIILSSGAVSMGRFDFIPDGLKKMGAEILFHKAAIRPGKPILFARFPKGAYYFGLPGNPIASAVGLRFFAYPLIRKMLGQQQEKSVKAMLNNDFTKSSPFRFFQKAAFDVREDGQLTVDILPGQESFKIKPLLQQNCWAIIPEEGLSVNAGSLIDIYPLSPDFGPDFSQS